MSHLTTEQVAELLLGIARSQLAMADAMESTKAGFKATHLRSNVESAARIKTNRPETLADLPSRLLLQMLGRNPPALDAVTRELEALLAGHAAAAERAITLDMTQNAAIESGMTLDMTR
jgi:hypothetical protein